MSRKLRVRAPREHQRVIFRDVMIFQLKLFLDGVKDIVLSPLSIIAAIADVVSPTDRVGKRFYHVMLMGERMDRWLNLFGAAEHADPGEDGLFGSSVAGSNSMLGRLETIVTGRNETGRGAGVGTHGGAGAAGASAASPASDHVAKPEFDDHPLDWDRNTKAMEAFDRELAQHRANVKDSEPGEFDPEDLAIDIFGQPDP